MADAKTAKSRETPVKEFSIRWGYKGWALPDLERNVSKMETMLRVRAAKWIFQGERGDTGFYHFQCYANWIGKKRAKQLAIELNGEGFDGINVQPSSNDGREALKRYCMKEDSRVLGPFADRKLYKGERIPHYDKLARWQQSLVDMVRKRPDDRTIVWFHDKIGGSGKRVVGDYLEHHRLAGVFPGARCKDF